SKEGLKEEHGRLTKEANSTPQEPRGRKPFEEKWETVGDKRQKQKAKKASIRQKEAQEAKIKARLKAPNSTAVVLTLQPEATKRGITYTELLEQAKQRISLQDLGISGVRPKTTVTGARMLEIPGASSGEKADALAEKLRATLNSVDVRISRPIRRAEIRLSDLDDSATQEEIVTAIATKGGCSPSDVKVGAIRRDRSGLGTAIASCPLTAVEKLVVVKEKDK
ncbi:uncharacterized protein LOC113506849, partial [Trichoplusia ni]|uniref:Uncharacterized protein LOC113506849 n=1 Tax=Trichoplusia ni TaxID=7111 RepID=A0A7E5WXB9_TRINI